MNSYQAKKIPLENILEKIGHKPSKMKGTDFWYHSPIHEENTPSFKVNRILNTWYDFGLSSGGTVIDLFFHMYSDNVVQALERVGQEFPDPNTVVSTIPLQKKVSAEEKENLLQLVSVDELTDRGLLDYVKERKINLEIAKKYLKQLSFRYDNQKWTQLALGFENDAGDYEFRKPGFKGFLGSTKTITTLNLKDGNKMAVFEGFFDFLSYLTYHNIHKYQSSAIVLNSTNLKTKAKSILDSYAFEKAYFFLDNDETGKGAFEYLSHDLPYEAVDRSAGYSQYKDLNEFIVE